MNDEDRPWWEPHLEPNTLYHESGGPDVIGLLAGMDKCRRDELIHAAVAVARTWRTEDDWFDTFNEFQAVMKAAGLPDHSALACYVRISAIREMLGMSDE